jgi:hypothetical protein
MPKCPMCSGLEVGWEELKIAWGKPRAEFGGLPVQSFSNSRLAA